MLLSRFVFCMLLVVPVFCEAQIFGKKKKESAPNGQPTALEPYYPQEVQEPKVRNKKSKGIRYSNPEEESIKRKEAIAKQFRKNEELMEKPQYSNPAYFGHKRPPKKRPPDKMKFCKVCGIRH
jgi:hypothetical protein